MKPTSALIEFIKRQQLGRTADREGVRPHKASSPRVLRRALAALAMVLLLGEAPIA
jgi:hypothetical protein